MIVIPHLQMMYASAQSNRKYGMTG